MTRGALATTDDTPDFRPALKQHHWPVQAAGSGAVLFFVGRTREAPKSAESFENISCACEVVEKRANPFARFLKRVDLPDNFCSQEVREQAQNYYLEESRKAAAAMPNEDDVVTGEFTE